MHRKQRIHFHFFVSIFLLCALPVHSQFSDTVYYQIETGSALSSRNFLPQWIISNRYGVLEDQKADGYLMGGVHLPYPNDKKFGLALGVDYLMKPQFSTSRLQQAYVKIKYSHLALSAGWIQRTVGTHNESLSSGSLALSANARPMPVILLSFPDYTPLPFLRRYLEFKGSLAHGWFEKERYIKNPYLHEKSFYLRGSAPSWPVKIHAGFVHFAQWGGTFNSTKLAHGFSDYWRVFLGRNGADPAVGVEYVNALGNHLGILDFGINWSFRDFNMLLYRQKPFEDRLSITRYPLFQDQLLGLNFVNKHEKTFLKEVLYEFLYTKYQSGPGIPDPPAGVSVKNRAPNYGYRYGGRDDYYNNFLYRSGWTYNGRTLGTPLFTTRDRAEFFIRDIKNFGEAVINNRIIAHHFALKGAILRNLKYRFFATYSRNYGTYAGLNNGRYKWASREPNYDQYQYVFKHPQNQYYFLLSSIYAPQAIKHFTIEMSVALDRGSLYKSYGVFIKLKQEGVMFYKSKKK